MKVPKEITATVEAPAIVLPPEKLPEPPKVGDKNVAPTTTAAEDITHAGQRRVNLIWETTQGLVAVMVTGVTLYVAASVALRGSGTEAFLLLSNAFFFVITTYMIRTNHTKIGGVQDEAKRRGE